MGFRRIAASVGASVLVVAGLALAGASTASADQVWHQSQGRASADAACPTSTAADLAAGWSEWNRSYEMWMNGGKGGWTCTRSITWAKDGANGVVHPSAGCVLFSTPFHLNFGGGWSLPPGSKGYTSVDCTTGGALTTIRWTVYAPEGFNALALCEEVLPATGSILATGTDVYQCVPAL